MKRRSRLIIMAFSVSFAMMAALSFFALRQFSSLMEYSQQVDHTNKVITNLYEIETAMKDVDLYERGYMITRDSSYLRGLFGIYDKIIPATAALQELTKNDKIQKEKLIQLRTVYSIRMGNTKDNLKFIDTAKLSHISRFFQKGEEDIASINRYVDHMRLHEYDILREKSRSKIYYQQIASSTIKYLLLVFAVITVVLFLVLIRELKRRILYQEELQNKVSDLKRSHTELEQVAYAVSHDLQEPLRKIQIFSNRLLYVKKENLDTESRETLGRINRSATRMHELIDDLVNLTSLIKEGETEEVDLNKVLQTAVGDLDEKINEKNAQIHREALPEVIGHPRQLQLLFKSLLDNAIKFSREGVTPVVSVRYDRVNGDELTAVNPGLATHSFYRVTFADNGIGFENKFINKIFQIFQRLHNQQSEYAGKGIGLALCQRVMVNHNGYILAHGHPGVGATFKLYFPVKD